MVLLNIHLPKEIKSNTDKIDSNKEYVLLDLPINPDISTPIPIGGKHRSNNNHLA